VIGKAVNELDNENGVESIVFGAPEDKARGAWWDGYTLRERIFEDGQKEVTVTREKHFQGAAIMPKARAKRGESEQREANEDDAGRRAKKHVRLKCKAISADRMVTLTYRENMQDRETVLRHWDLFRRKMGKHKQFDYVAVVEKQERGAFHFHVAVRGRQVYALLRSIWQSIVGLGPNGEQMAQVNVRDPHKFGFGNKGAHKIATYIAKYCGKDMQTRDIGKHRYFASKGIPVPEVRSRWIDAQDQMSAVQAAFAALEGYDMTGLQTWCNNGLGVVYLATAPGCHPADDYCPF
jgi:hypothetical protein